MNQPIAASTKNRLANDSGERLDLRWSCLTLPLNR